jgi:hypothetical protein
MTASTLRWPLLAVIGLLVALAVGLLATRLVSERIGISSEPITAGESLTPKRANGHERAHNRQPALPPAQTTVTGSDYTGPSSSSSGGADGAGSGSGTDSAGSDGGGDSKRGGLGDATTPPVTASPAPSSPSGGAGTDTTTEPGDD